MTEDPIGQSEPECSPNQDAPNAPAKPLPSLTAFYSDPRAKPAALLKAMRDAKLRSFDAEDQANALRKLDDADPRLLRTLKLASASIPRGPTSIVPPTIEWAGRVVRTKCLVEGLTLNDPNQPPALTFRQICSACKAIAVRNPKETRKSLNLVAIAAAWLRVTRALEPDDLLPALGDSGLLGKIDGSSAAQTSRVVNTIVRPPVRLDVARALLAQDLNWRIRQSSLETSVRRLQSELQRSNSDLQTNKATVQLLEQQLHETGNAITALNRDLKLSAQRIQDQQVQSRHDLNMLRDRSTSFMKTLRDRWISSALEAGRMDPPRTAVINERLEMALSEIEQEMSWLTSLD